MTSEEFLARALADMHQGKCLDCGDDINPNWPMPGVDFYGIEHLCPECIAWHNEVLEADAVLGAVGQTADNLLLFCQVADGRGGIRCHRSYLHELHLSEHLV